MAARREQIELTVARWGNSLAVRLPAKSARRIGVAEGDTLVGEFSPDGRLVLTHEGRAVSKTESRRLRRFLLRQATTAPVVEELRRGARY